MSRTPDELDRAWAAFSARVVRPAGSGWGAVAAAVGTVGALALLLVTAPALLVSDMPQDTLIPLDGAWRVASGQWPHRDFVTPVGDLYYAILGLAAALRGPLDPRLLAVANALVGPVVLGMALLATRSRLPEPLRGLAAVSTSLLAMSPRTLDALGRVGFNAMYNRWGWALATVAALLALLPPEGDRRRVRPEDVALVAAVLLAAVWIKVTFAAFVVVVAVLGLVAAPANRATLAVGLAVGGGLAALSLLTPAGAAYLGDLRLAAAAGAEGPGLLRPERLAPTLELNRSALFVVAGLVAAMLRTAPDDAERAAASLPALGILGLTAAGLAVSAQNHDHTVPLLAVGALVLVSRLRARGDAARVPLAAAVAAAWLAWPIALDAMAVVSAGLRTRGATVSMVRDPASPLHRVVTPDVLPADAGRIGLVIDGDVTGNIYDNLPDTTWPVDNPVILGDAVALLDRNGVRDRPIASLTFSPFFPYLLGTVPPRGLLAWFDYQRTFGADWDTRACAALTETEVVLQPKVWLIEGVHEEHEGCLRAEFAKVDETPLWALWVRRGEGG